MALDRIAYPNALPTEQNDYVKQNELLEIGFLRVNNPWWVDGTNIVKGAVFQVGGTIYLGVSVTAIGGVASDYIKLTPINGGANLQADFVASLVGVTWSTVYNGYYDVNGNLYVFDEILALNAGDIASAKTLLSKSFQNFQTADVNFTGTFVSDALHKRGVIYRNSSGVESYKKLISKVIEIGDWNMDSTANKSVAHGVSSFTKIRTHHVSIIDDTSVALFSLFGSVVGTDFDGWYYIDATNVVMGRRAAAAGYFDTPNFDASPFNRGFIYLEYEED